MQGIFLCAETLFTENSEFFHNLCSNFQIILFLIHICLFYVNILHVFSLAFGTAVSIHYNIGSSFSFSAADEGIILHLSLFPAFERLSAFPAGKARLRQTGLSVYSDRIHRFYLFRLFYGYICFLIAYSQHIYS